ncbi:MAG: peptidase T, partial [Clostridiales bacterium]|nr:peptidase T [Clostridiales bacterium]
MELLERFLKYVSINTNSDENCGTCPSSPAQRDLANELVKEMLDMGITDARADEHSYVYGTIPATKEGYAAIGLIAHMDTSPAVAGGPVKPRTLRYEGGDIVLNQEKNIVLPAKDYPFMKQDIGSELVVTDGTTLLGADDKAGVAIIMTVAEKLLKDRSIPHGKICIGFTPDEEIGRGADLFDVKNFGADFAYTLDGADIAGIEYENFNAASAVIKVHGFSIHPGTAKGKMINAAKLAMEFDSLLPALEIPENTEGYEGFHHLCGIRGEEQEAQIVYIIRDHDRTKFEAKKKEFQRVTAYLNDKY